jgi:hypothetical protein
VDRPAPGNAWTRNPERSRHSVLRSVARRAELRLFRGDCVREMLLAGGVRVPGRAATTGIRGGQVTRRR